MQNELPFINQNYHLSEKLKAIVIVILSLVAIITIFVSLIVDYCTSIALSWSLIAIVSIVTLWLIAIPSLTSRTTVVFKTLLLASSIPIPFLIIISLILKLPVIFTLGACISLIAIFGAWVIYGVFCEFCKNLWRALGFSLLILIPIPIAITHISAYFLAYVPFDFTSDILNSLITLMIPLICFGFDYLVSSKKKQKVAQNENCSITWTRTNTI